MLQHVDTHLYQKALCRRTRASPWQATSAKRPPCLIPIPRHFFIEHVYHQRGNSLTWGFISWRLRP